MNTVAARPPASAYCARLKASLRPNWRRCSTSASPAPTTCAATSAVGEIRYRPATNTRSVSENECESRCSCTCTTNTSVAAKAATQAGQGRSSEASGVGSSRTTPANRVAAAAASSRTSSITRRRVAISFLLSTCAVLVRRMSARRSGSCTGSRASRGDVTRVGDRAGAGPDMATPRRGPGLNRVAARSRSRGVSPGAPPAPSRPRRCGGSGRARCRRRSRRSPRARSG